MTEHDFPTHNESHGLQAYTGRWVAFIADQIAGHGFTRETALESAKAHRPKERAHVRLIPPRDDASLFQLLDLIRPALPDNLPLYVVGGAVRDHLLKRPIHDLDFVLPGSGIPVARKAANYLGGEFYVLDEVRGTGRILLFRPDGRRLILDFAAQRGDDLETDLRDRDFTVNALAMNVMNPQEVFDPCGGALDIRQKTVKPCSPDSFETDPLRVLRAVRMATSLGFVLATETRQLLRQAISKLEDISAERRRDEIIKILGGPRPAAALRAMDMLGILPQIFPELTALKGIQQSPPHVHDVWEHTLSTIGHLDNLLNILGALEHDPDASGNLALGLAVLRLGRYRAHIHAHLNDAEVPERPWRGLLMLAALYHDAGKAETRSLDENGRIRFFKHEGRSARLINAQAAALKLSNHEAQRLSSIARHHMRPHFLATAEGAPTRRAVFRFFRDTQIAGVDICLLNMADVLATYERTLPPETWKNYLDLIRELLENWWERPAESVHPPTLVSGKDLIEQFKLSPGPAFGSYLNQLQEAQAAGEIQNREDALAFIRQLIEKTE